MRTFNLMFKKQLFGGLCIFSFGVVVGLGVSVNLQALGQRSLEFAPGLYLSLPCFFSSFYSIIVIIIAPFGGYLES